MPTRFTTLDHALDKGLETMPAAAAVKQIETWETELKGAEFTGAKGLVHDLEALKKLLHAEPVDGAAVQKIVAKLGGETTRSASHATDEKAKAKLKEVGEKLEAAGK